MNIIYVYKKTEAHFTKKQLVQKQYAKTHISQFFNFFV